jgi:hypothetical protein
VAFGLQQPGRKAGLALRSWLGYSWPPHRVGYAGGPVLAQWPSFEIKFLYLFPELIQTLKIHISLFVAP